MIFRPQDKLKWINIVTENFWLFNVTVKIVNIFSVVIYLAHQFTFLLFMVKQRLTLIRYAADNIGKLYDKNIAWENSVRAVSYTHLDVYNRQVLFYFIFVLIIIIFFFLS